MDERWAASLVRRSWRAWMLPMTIAVLASAAEAKPADIAAALAAPGRPAAYVALDEGRQPARMLAFFGLERGMRVLDYGAGGGYYSEIMAQAVGPTGMVIGWNPPAFAARENVQAALDRIRRRSPNSAFYATPTTALAFPAASFDFVMLHLSYHDTYWESAEFGFARTEPETVVRAIWDATRPGGIVAIVDHAAVPGRDTRAEVANTHRIDPRIVRADFERAGFRLEAESTLLRSPSDDRSGSVFDRSIRGRTDRFAMRFRKPSR